MRNSIRRSGGNPALRSIIEFWISMAQRTASTTLRNSTMAPSPVRFTIRPLWTAIVGSIKSLRSARNLASVRSSSAPVSRLKPTTSAARIAASFLDSVMRKAMAPASVRPGRGERAGRLQQQGRDQRDRQRHAQQEEGVAESHDVRLLTHNLTDRDDRLVTRGRQIRDTMTEEISGQAVDPRLHHRVLDADALYENVRVELLALSEERLQQRDTDGAADVP